LRREWRIRSGRDEIRLIPLARASAEERRTGLAPPRALIALHRPFRTVDPAGRRLLLDILAELEGANAFQLRTDTDFLRDRVERAVANGRLVAVSVPLIMPLGGVFRPEEEDDDGGDAPLDTVPEKTWIEIELLDVNDEPLAGHPYRIELPDGSVRTGTVGANGVARLDGIDPGSCTVTLPRQNVTTYRFASAGDGDGGNGADDAG